MGKVTKLDDRRETTVEPTVDAAVEPESTLVFKGQRSAVDFPKVSERRLFYGADMDDHITQAKANMMGDYKTLICPDGPQAGRIFAPAVTNDYTLHRHEDILDTVEGMCVAAGLDYDLGISLPRDGARMRAELRLTGIETSIDHVDSNSGGHDRLNPTLTIFNSYDTGWALKVICGTFRLVCSNGMTIGEKWAEFRKEHHQGLEKEDVELMIKTSVERVMERTSIWSNMARAVVSEAEVKTAINRMKLNQTEFDAFMMLEEAGTGVVVNRMLGSAVVLEEDDHWRWNREAKVDTGKIRDVNFNRWTLYNCMTQFTNHHVDSEIKRVRMESRIASMEREWARAKAA